LGQDKWWGQKKCIATGYTNDHAKQLMLVVNMTFSIHKELVYVPSHGTVVEVRMCFQFWQGLVDINDLSRARGEWGIKFTNIRQPMLKLKAHSFYLPWIISILTCLRVQLP
jgi:hypothetical protein